MNNIKSAYLNPAMECNLGALKWTIFLTIFTALAILLPYACHQFGIAGMVFLPMHFAVMTAAIVMGLRGGVTVALVSPILSYSISGMPPVISLLPMTVELVTYALVLSLLTRKIKMPMIWALVAAMISGRLVSLGLVSGILHNSGISNQAHNLFVIAIPGILIQLTLIPLVSTKIIGFLKDK